MTDADIDEAILAVVEPSWRKVLTTDGKWHTGTGEVYRIFGSLDSARAFAHQVATASPRVECHVYDSKQTHIERIVAA